MTAQSKPELYEYNADTPTSAFEAATFQWLWLEEPIANGTLPANADQFATACLRGPARIGFTGAVPGPAASSTSPATQDAVEDRQTVRFLEDLALAGRRSSPEVRGHGQRSA